MSFPDGPKSPPLWRALRWIFSPLSVLDQYARTYGDTFGFKSQFSGSVVYISDPESLQALFNADAQSLNSARMNNLMQPLLGDYSVVLLDGEPHAQQRKLLMPHFHGEHMRSYGHLIQAITHQTLSTWSEGQSFQARPAFQDISLKVILEAVFGVSSGRRSQQLIQVLSSILNAFDSEATVLFLFFRFLQQDLGAWSPWGHFLRLRAEMDQLLYAEIAERRDHLAQSSSTSPDILSMLIAATDETGVGLSDRELRDELVTLLVAGHETTASAMTWAFYWIASRPDVYQRLWAELRSVDLANNLFEVTQLPYLQAVCQETLRLYPIAIMGFPRTVKQPIQIGQYLYPEGTVLIPSIYLAHHRPSVYPDPKQFKPERFLQHQFTPYEFLPFGGGVRRCIGQAFALFEMKVVIATLLSRINLSVASHLPIRPVRRGLTLAPPKHLKFQVDGFKAGDPTESSPEVTTTYV